MVNRSDDELFRKTYVTIDGEQLKENAQNICKSYPDYKYYIGVVKNNAYHHGMKCVNDFILGGVNYLAVSSLEEAIAIRTYNQTIPILCLEPIELEYIYDALNNNVTVTVENLDYLKELVKMDLKYELKVHLAVDSGMHRLGFVNSSSFTRAYLLIKDAKYLVLEGVYSHFATSGVADPYYDKQVKEFLDITKDIDLSTIPIVHFGRSLSLVEHPKLAFCNGIRLGIVLYGFNQSLKENNSLKGKLRALKRKRLQKKYQCSETFLQNDLNVKPALAFYTTIMSRREITPGDFVGYGANFLTKKSGYIYTLPVGYADGVTKDYGYVLIHKEKCLIVADCMDMILVFSQTKYQVGEHVEIFGDNIPIFEVTNRLGINAYHLFNQISNRVTTVHVLGNEKEEIKY